MDTLVKFGPMEATREQRQALSDRAAALNATQDRPAEPFAEQLSQRYINGELSLAEVNAQLDAYYQAQAPAPVPAREPMMSGGAGPADFGGHQGPRLSH